MSDENIQEDGPGPRIPLTWAAYVAGRYGPMLGLWLDETWERILLGIVPSSTGDDWSHGLEDINRPLRELAIADAVKAPVLVELHRAVDAFHVCSRCLIRAWRAGDVERARGAFNHCHEWLEVVFDLNMHLFTPAAGVADWFFLGTAVGRCRRECRDAAASGELRSAVLDPVRDATRRLQGSADNVVLQPLLAVEEPEAERGGGHLSEARPAYVLTQELAHADVAVQAQLRKVAVPRPVLELDAERLVYYGCEIRLAELTPAYAAALWVLAEKTGQPVSRATIRREGKIQTREDQFEPIMARLRTCLAGMAGAPAETGPFSPAFLRQKIRGLRGPTPHCGPYLLDFSPELVRVSPPRPAWMRQD